MVDSSRDCSLVLPFHLGVRRQGARGRKTVEWFSWQSVGSKGAGGRAHQVFDAQQGFVCV
eukprot:6309825-Lingulodinium_polyedra.AAC.1